MRKQLNSDIVIIARTDALAGLGYDAALSRLKAAIAAGADVAFLEGVESKEQGIQICKDMAPTPCLYNVVPGGVSPVLNVQEAKECGYKIMITPILGLGAVFEAVNKVYKAFKEEGDSNGTGYPVRPIFEACGLEEALEFDIQAGGKLYSSGV